MLGLALRGLLCGQQQEVPPNCLPCPCSAGCSPPLPATSRVCVQVLELEPGNSIADKAVKRLLPVVEERREKLKEEMVGARGRGANATLLLCPFVCSQIGQLF